MKIRGYGLRNAIWPILVALGAVGIGAGALAQPGVPIAAVASELPPGPGQELTQAICSSCHSPVVITHQRLSGDDWADLVYQMADRGALASDEELTQIINYLANSFPADMSAVR